MSDQRIYKVKFSFPYDWPIVRQTPDASAKWDRYEFILNDEISECDFWVIFSKYNLKKETCYCPPDNVIFLPSETYSIEHFHKQFLKQFSLIITCQREIVHPNKSYNLGGHPWFVNKSYNELITSKPVKKTKLLSLITSNKVMNDGHKKRLDFAYKLKDYFNEDIDLFGRGINGFDDKWDVLAPYKYSIAIENDNTNDWLTEKFYDCHLAYTYPFYYGCPNAEKYFSDKSFTRININDFTDTVKVIENILIDNDHYNNHLPYIESERLKALNNYNIFPLLVSYMSKMNGDASKEYVTIHPETILSKGIIRLKKMIS